MSSTRARKSEKLARELEKQVGWAARRNAALAAKRSGRPIPGGVLGKTPSAEPMLAVQDCEPDNTEPVALLAEIPAGEYGETRRAAESILFQNGEAVFYGPTVPREFLGRIAVAMYRRGDRPEKVRDIVEWAWGAGTPFIIKAAGRELFNLLRYCEFAPPDDLPENVEVWRAARGVSADITRTGLSWSLDRDAACGFLHILRVKFGVRGKPVLIKRTIPRSAIVMYTALGFLDEVIFDAGPPAGEIDGTEADWMKSANRYWSLYSEHSDEGHEMAGEMIPWHALRSSGHHV